MTMPAQGTRDDEVVRQATVEDVELVAAISAAGFLDDPVMIWLLPDQETRRAQLPAMFRLLARGYLPDRGTIHVLAGVTVAFWRHPEFDHWDTRGGGSGDDPIRPEDVPFADDVLERMALLDEAMRGSHPHEPHWYLNVVSTIPECQGRGFGRRVLEPVLATCDRAAMPAYLESSNPRNVTLYERLGFVATGEIPLPAGPSMLAMWRHPAG